ncbi:hypothetical protein ADL04_21605 [Streptomyces sp. NRRL B-3648]|nr:hypothetical protein ADL04_21605 [Streptomyces sp. NRRL B-3648]
MAAGNSPGGIFELNETPEAGVAREVLEETGIHVEVDELTGVYKNLTRGIVALVFRCKPSDGTERTSSESTAVSWLTPDEVSERMSEVFVVSLLDALDVNGPHVRSHGGKRSSQRDKIFSPSSSPGCAPLRRARFPAPPRAPLLPSARSARAAPTRAHWWIGPAAMS